MKKIKDKPEIKERKLQRKKEIKSPLYAWKCTGVRVYIYMSWQVLDKISNKFILIWFSDCCPPVKSSSTHLRFYSFWENCVLEMVIKLCSNFWSCILVVLPNSLYYNPIVHIRHLSGFARVLLQWIGFSFFLMLSLLSRWYSLIHQIIQRFLLHQRLSYEHQQFDYF